MKKIVKYNDKFMDCGFSEFRFFESGFKGYDVPSGIKVFSLKYKKRRILISGKVEKRFCYHHTIGTYFEWYFKPNNLEKFKKFAEIF